jgi:hypothetical protein
VSKASRANVRFYPREPMKPAQPNIKLSGSTTKTGAETPVVLEAG